jgi:DNA primase
MSQSAPITPRDFAQTVKDRIAIDLVVGEYVPTMVRAGNSFKACCPFHKEKTPSFHVNPEHGFYHCFGCQAHGDAIKFVMEIEKIDFMAALEILARKAGLTMPRFAAGEERTPDEEKRLQSLRDLCTWAEEFFIRQLREHPRGSRAREYLVGRGLTDAHIEQYHLGYAPDGYEVLLREAERKGWKAETVAEAGLASRRDQGGFIDRFRDRVMFPIADKNGQVVAFAGRILEKLEDVAKYINSAETPLFKKSRLLYGVAAAREAIKTEDCAILMEGYMDWIAMHRRGIRNVLAGMGTALTDEQAQLVRRMTRNVILLYDGDAPGQKAMARSTEVLLKLGAEVKAATLPAEHDPDTFLDAVGVQPMRDILAQAPGAVNYLIEKAAQAGDLLRPEGKAEAVGKIAPLLLAIEDPVTREGYSSRAAARFGLRLETLEAAMRRRAPRRIEPAPPGQFPLAGEVEEPTLEPSRTEQNLLYILLQKKDQWDLLQAIEAEWFQSRELRQIFERFYECQRDVREGGDPPESLFALCENDREKLWLSRILMLPTQRFEGEVGGFEERLNEAFQLQVLKLRRQWSQRRKRELAQDLQMILADSPTGTGQLEAIHQLTRKSISWQADLLERDGAK